MDSADFKQLLISAAIIIVPLLFSYISEKIKKVRRLNNRESKHQKPSESPFDWSPGTLQPSPPEKAESKMPLHFEEGMRVTEDTAEKTAIQSSDNEKESNLEDLRKAVIWSEILTPKFNNH